MEGKMLFYNYTLHREGVCFGTITPDMRYADPDLLGAYRWLEKEVGFYPLFLSVGDDDAALYMTGYDDNWRVHIGSSSVDGRLVQKYRRKGEFPNIVLFSFEKAEGIFMDFHAWHIALNAQGRQYRLSDYETRLIFKPSWSRAQWVRKAKNDSGSVQLVVPELSLALAGRVHVRNHETRKALEGMGFQNIELKRVRVNSW